jgi:hypothetical protein
MAGCCGLTGGRRRRTRKVKKSQKRTMRRHGGKKRSTFKGFSGKWKTLARLSK